jgi:hypothetical protein
MEWRDVRQPIDGSRGAELEDRAPILEGKFMPRYYTTISHASREAMLDLVRKYKIGILDHTQSSAGGYRVDAVLEPADIQKLQQAGYQVQQGDDADEKGKARQKQVGQGDRYKR